MFGCCCGNSFSWLPTAPGMFGHDGIAKKSLSLRAGFEPAREDPIGFQVQRLNHSAITAPVQFARLNGVHSFCYYIWKLIIKAKGRKGNQLPQADDFTTDFSRLLVALLGNRRCAYRGHWALNSFKRKRFLAQSHTGLHPFSFNHVFPLNIRPNPNILMLHLQKLTWLRCRKKIISSLYPNLDS